MIPARDALLAAYSAVVAEIADKRGAPHLTNAFYAKVGAAVFDACYAATQQSKSTAPCLRVVPAPVGAGKTTFAIAFIAALVRLGGDSPDIQHSSALVVEQIAKADEMYRILSDLLPGRVAVWTKDHDTKHSKPREDAKVQSPAAKFDVSELELYPVVIVTHAFFKGVRGSKARSYVDERRARGPRALTVIDEQSDNVEIYDIALSDASAVLEAVQQVQELDALAGGPLHVLVKFMAEKARSTRTLDKPSDDLAAWHSAAEALNWFTTSEAQECARRYKTIPSLEATFKFAAAIAGGRAFVARGSEQRFVGYHTGLPVLHGSVLLDATADVDGLVRICPWRQPVKVPQASYKNLEIVHVPSCTNQQLPRFLATAKNQFKYADWMRATILEHTVSGQKVLVVCKKVLVANQRVPFWPERDERFRTPEVYTSQYGWELEGRKLCVTYWGGNGIGANAWHEAEVVFLFDEHYIPRRAAIARTQGLLDVDAAAGPLADMKSLRSRCAEVDAVYEGHLLRHSKQMALRGNARNHNEAGECGVQKLVCTGNLERLLSSAQRLFPGATVVASGDVASRKTYAQKLIAVLSRPDLPPNIATKKIGEQVGEVWRCWGQDVLKRPATQESLRALGWQYRSKRGRGGGMFVRVSRRP